MMESLNLFWQATGLANLTLGMLVMILLATVLIYWAVIKEFEPVFLVALGFATILANIPLPGTEPPSRILSTLYEIGIHHDLLPLLLLVGLGTMVDFGPLLAMPSLLFIGGAAQLGIFVTLWLALACNALLGIPWSVTDAATIGMMGGAHGSVLVFLSTRLAPELLGTVVVALYCAIATLPLLQPPIMQALTTKQERTMEMPPLRNVSQWEKRLVPLLLLLLTMLLLPHATLLLGMFVFGNLLKEFGILERFASPLSIKTTHTSLIHLLTLLFGLALGSQLSAENFLCLKTVLIVVLAIIAFAVGTATAVLMAKLLSRYSKSTINPLIGAAGIAVIPRSVRVVNKVALASSPQQPHGLLPPAMGINLAGIIGSTVAAGTLLALLG